MAANPPTASQAAQASHLVGPLLRYVREHGEQLDLAAFGLTTDALERDFSPISNVDLGRLFDEAARVLDEPHLGLVLPAQLKFQQYAIPELAARASPTLRESFQQWAAYARLVHPSVVFVFSEADGRAQFTHRTLGYPRGLSRHLNEFALAAATYFGRQTTVNGPQILEAHFVHARPRSLEVLESFFQTSSVSFGAEVNALVIDSASLDAPQHTADARMLATMRSMGEQSLRARPLAEAGFRALVAERVRQQLGAPIRIRKIAHELHMSVRTLQRRLDDEGVSFAELVDAVREQVARELIGNTDSSVAEVAEQLGFAELATFSRAFKRWTGQAPSVFRATNAG